MKYEVYFERKMPDKEYVNFEHTQYQINVLNNLYFHLINNNENVDIKLILEELRFLTGEYTDKDVIARHVRGLIGK